MKITNLRNKANKLCGQVYLSAVDGTPSLLSLLLGPTLLPGVLVWRKCEMSVFVFFKPVEAII